MDFTLLFIVILMLLAIQSGLKVVAIGLGVMLLIISMKNKYLFLASLVGIALIAGITFFGVGSELWFIGGGLFLIVIILAKKESDVPAQGYYPGGGGGGEIE